MAAAGGPGRWTRYFAVASALSGVALQVAFLLGAPLRATAVLGLFGAVLPMAFGMAYLLLPSYLGRTLSTERLPGVHLVAAYAGAVLLVADELVGPDPRLGSAGGVLWTVGVAVFLGTLLWTAAPVIASEPRKLLETSRPKRSPRLAGAAIPVAVGYLAVGTVALLSATTPLPDLVGASLPVAVHYYAVGFAALLVFALGARLLTGFFRVSPPANATRAVLLCGAVAPAVLGVRFWNPPWFRVGAALAFAAMAGYAALVGIVAFRTDRQRVGLPGISLGAAAGVVGVGLAAPVAFGGAGTLVAAHVPVILDGFFLLTIAGYAYQFFPVTNGQFRGATERTALATLGLLAAGTALLAIGTLAEIPPVRSSGAATALVGAAGYAYLLGRRLLG